MPGTWKMTKPVKHDLDPRTTLFEYEFLRPWRLQGQPEIDDAPVMGATSERRGKARYPWGALRRGQNIARSYVVR